MTLFLNFIHNPLLAVCSPAKVKIGRVFVSKKKQREPIKITYNYITPEQNNEEVEHRVKKAFAILFEETIKINPIPRKPK